MGLGGAVLACMPWGWGELHWPVCCGAGGSGISLYSTGLGGGAVLACMPQGWGRGSCISLYGMGLGEEELY